MGYWTATWLLTVKNLRLLWRRPGALIVVLIASVAAMLIMFLVQRSYDAGDGVEEEALKVTNPVPYSLEKIPRCIPSMYSDCITLAYVTSGDSRVKTWVDKVAQQSGIPSNETREFANSETLNKFLVDNPNRTQAAYIFEDYNMGQLNNGSVSFIVQYNFTEQTVFPLGSSRFNTHVVVPSMIHAMNKVLMPIFGNTVFNIDMKASIYPHPRLFGGDDAFIEIGALLLFSIYFLVLVTFLSKMTEEKELGLRDAMRLAGLSQSQHYISWGLPMFTLLFIVTLVLLALGNAFQFKFFLNTEFPVYFLSFLTFSIALFGWTFFLAAFLRSSRTVSNVCFLIFIFMYMFGSFQGLIYLDKSNGEPLLAKNSLYWREIFAIVPSTMFTRCIFLISFTTTKDFKVTFADIGRPESYPLRTCWYWMLGTGVVAFLLSIYFDNVLPSPHGFPLSPIYFLQPSYWKGVFARTNRPDRVRKDVTPPSIDDQPSASDQDVSTNSQINPSDSIGYDPQEEDPAVRRERELVASGERDGDPLVIKNIVRRFKKFTAVDNVSLSVRRNTAFACLGHNGAGKSTLFKMLVTSIGITEGDAFIYGHSVKESLSATRRILGVCQQHDALWDDLSGAEHIELFAALKGLDKAARNSEMQERLVDVGLGEFLDRRAGAYSGGMQRRLSVAISLTGNPRILLLDEFSTGADPLVRRDLWATIERAKKNRVVFIITHSMAEAERLGDNIGIMAKGKLRVLGTSLYLKNKFGTGYRIVVKLSGATEESLVEKLSEVCPGSSLIESAPAQNGNDTVLAQYSLPRRSSDKNVLAVMEMLEERKEEFGVLDFSLDSATLDQVFQSITSLSEDVVEPDVEKNKGCLSCFGKSRNREH